jgi:hypothetical protein
VAAKLLEQLLMREHQRIPRPDYYSRGGCDRPVQGCFHAGVLLPPNGSDRLDHAVVIVKLQ